MGWTRIGTSDDMIGDTPADGFQSALNDYTKGGAKKISVAELLGALTQVLRADGAQYLEDGKGVTVTRVSAKLPSAVENSTDGKTTPELSKALSGALKRMEATYHDTFDRLPRLNEVLGTVAFVLSGEPQLYLSDIGNNAIRGGDIVADVKPA